MASERYAANCPARYPLSTPPSETAHAIAVPESQRVTSSFPRKKPQLFFSAQETSIAIPVARHASKKATTIHSFARNDGWPRSRRPRHTLDGLIWYSFRFFLERKSFLLYQSAPRLDRDTPNYANLSPDSAHDTQIAPRWVTLGTTSTVVSLACNARYSREKGNIPHS